MRLCVKAATELPPSAKALSDDATGVLVLKTVPLAVNAEPPSEVTVAPKVALVAVMADAVGILNVGTPPLVVAFAVGALVVK